MLGPDSERHGEVSDDVVLVSSTPIAPNARVQLAEQAVALSDLALKLDELVEQCAWLAAALGRLAEGKPPTNTKGAKWEAKKLGRFAAGHYIQLATESDAHTIWALARPPGHLILGHYGGRGVDASLRKAIRIKPFSTEALDVPDDVSASLLLDLHEVTELYTRKDVKGLQQRVVTAFTEFFRLVK